MTETPSHKKKSRNISLDYNPPQSTKSRLNYSKAQDFIYTNAFKIKKRQNSSRPKTDKFSRTLSSDLNHDLKVTINKQQDEITRLKTQVQYAAKELVKVSDENSYSDISCLHKMLITQKRQIEDLRESLKKKDEKIEDIKKKSKSFLVQELEAENKELTELCKKQNFELKKLLEEYNKKDTTYAVEEEFQKSVLVSQLKKEKERFNESIEEKNQEIIKWRERVMELEKKEGKKEKKAKEKWKSREKEMAKEICVLKGQLENSRKHCEEIENKFELRLAQVQMEFVSEKNAKRMKFSPDCVVRVRNLDPVPAVLEFVQRKASKLGCTVDQVFYKIVMSFSNFPKASEFQEFVEIPDEFGFCIDELVTSLSQNKQISISNFSDFCHKVKFTPKSIQKLLKHLAFRFQVSRIPRSSIQSLFPKPTDLKSPEHYISLLSNPPFDLNSLESRSLIDYLYPQGLKYLKKSVIISILASRLPTYTLLSPDSESLFYDLLSTTITDQFDSFLSYCKDLDLHNTSTIHISGLLKCFESHGIPLTKDLSHYISLASYKSSHKPEKVNYPKFLSAFSASPEKSHQKIENFYLHAIKSELRKQAQEVSSIFKSKNNQISGQDFIEGLSKLCLDSIPPIHLSILLDSLQYKESSELCVDFTKFVQSLNNLT